MWQSLVKHLPNNILCFVRKALIFCLPNKSNLYRWKISENNICSMCNKAETQLHILSNCVSYLDRYKWRHDSILKSMMNTIVRNNSSNVEVLIDCDGYNNRCTSSIFRHSRPDIAVIIEKKVVIIELTVCFETNTEKSRRYKQNRYRTLESQLLINCDAFEIILLEFTTLGFIAKNSFTQFSEFLRNVGVYEDRTIIKCMETAIRCSYYIFCCRNNMWTNPELLNFF